MRIIHDIPGGVFPPEQKSLSNQQQIDTLPLFAEYIIPLKQHIGVAATPCVNVGDRVLKGQQIGVSTGFMSTAVHAPTSGTVKAIDYHLVSHPSGLKDIAITLTADGQDTPIDSHPRADWQALGKRQLLDIIRSAGVAGLGGASFPTAVKLDGQRPIDTLIINGTECEPYITADDMLMREHADEIRTGVEILAHLLGNPPTVVIGIEDNKPEAIALMKIACAGTKIEIASFPTKYPSGGEKQLIQILTAKEVPSGDIPAALGIVMQNVGTARAIKQAVVDDKPLIERITTVTGEGIEQRGNFHTRIGTRVEDLLQHLNFDASNAKVVMGGPMMGFELPSLDVPVVKATNCLLIPGYDTSAATAECIRCGLCAEACPAQLLPQQLYWYSKADDHDKLNAYHLNDCIECGACAYVCPSKLPLVQHYRAAKASIKQAAEDQLRSDRARARFEFRKQRMDAAEAEKEAKRLARKAATEQAKLAKQAAANSPLANEKANKPDDVADPLAVARAKLKQTQAGEADQQSERLQKQLKSIAQRIEFIDQQIADTLSEHGEEASLIPQLQSKRAASVLKQEQLQAKLAEYSAASRSAESNGPADKASLEATHGNASSSAAPSSAAPAPSSTSAPTDIERAENAIDSLTAARAEKSLDERQREALKRIDDNITRCQQQLVDNDDQQLRDKLQLRISKLEAKRAETQSSEVFTPSVQEASTDKALQAIERAKQVAAAQAQLSPEEKLQQQYLGLQARLEKAKARLSKAEAEDSEHIDAFRTAVNKIAAKLSEWTRDHDAN
ncbi:electron transport complex subunit RsxC [uncultured Umboniibacter sp.]|uniref:electron transport complex subunit RsxC n=1 Tax=uncultured Umboniibacter sp. TaxID=1798917 RepID=UPI00261897C0|nr:electron transport complex subunit RsxC [uncultured Umboniibacter sp.]